LAGPEGSRRLRLPTLKKSESKYRLWLTTWLISVNFLLHVSASVKSYHQIIKKKYRGKGNAIQLQALTGPEGSRRLMLPDFTTIGTWMWQGCQPYAPAAFTPRKYSWYWFLFEDESTPGS
jgi:hypothetical protein